MTGAKFDDVRVNTLGQYLKGTAAAWFRNAIEDPFNDITEGLGDHAFEEVVCQLFRRFVHGASAQKATQSYE
jgi:hypothetical protein